MEAIGIGVAITVISAAIIGGARWVLAHREEVATAAKQRTCRHEWEPIPPNVITGDTDWCVKYDARR